MRNPAGELTRFRSREAFSRVPFMLMEQDMRLEQLVSELIGKLKSESVADDRVHMLRLLQQWLELHLTRWNAETRARWSLESYASMDLGRYPIDEASLRPSEEVRQLDSVRPTTMDILGMRLRDIFWAGITLESEVTCPRCEERQLRILQDEQLDRIVLSCDLCAWSQFPEGQPWKGTQFLKPAPKERIARWRSEAKSGRGRV